MIFVDSWAWIALAAQGDRTHEPAMRQHQEFLRTGRRYVTTDFVLSEVISHLYRNHPANESQTFVNSLFAAFGDGTRQLIHVSPQQFHRAWIMRQRFHDKPDISFVDFTSMIVMQELGITDVFTGDAHFKQVNLGFHLFP
jgi:predicted nucleic acid-binding protein